MRTFGIALGLAAMVVVPSATMAQSEGAIVTRGQVAIEVNWVEYDGAKTLIIYSSYPDFACNTGEPVPFRWQTVLTPVYASHYHDNGLTFARVYEATYAEFEVDPYEFICGGAHTPWAEGVLHGMFYSIDVDPPAPGARVWGHVLNGMLTDLGDTCKSGLVKVEVIHMMRVAPGADYPACLPGCLEYRPFTGPTATCVGKR